MKVSDKVIHHTFDAGEGVLIPGEILHNAAEGCRNFLILQPFGCLPNHVVGRGIMKKLRELYPDVQILALDYDPDISTANIENRLQMLIMNAKAAELIVENGCVKGVKAQDGTVFNAEKVVVATGGVSYPQTGSTGDGYILAKQAGHGIVPVRPSLVPLEAHEGFCTDLMGLSLRNIAIKVFDTKKNNKIIYEDFGEMLFTHFGVSGPVILSASSHMREMERGRYKISIDLKPALSEEQLDTSILRDFSENINRNFINALNSMLPKKLVPVIVKLSKIPMAAKVNQITKEQRRNLAVLLKNFTVTITDYRPVEEAIVTSGGVDTKQINPKTMQSKLTEGLYFAGEVIDVDAYTGGFNLQIAFSTGRLAAQSVAAALEKGEAL